LTIAQFVSPGLNDILVNLIEARNPRVHSKRDDARFETHQAKTERLRQLDLKCGDSVTQTNGVAGWINHVASQQAVGGVAWHRPQALPL
jgi:hypothetical protein